MSFSRGWTVFFFFFFDSFDTSSRMCINFCSSVFKFFLKAKLILNRILDSNSGVLDWNFIFLGDNFIRKRWCAVSWFQRLEINFQIRNYNLFVTIFFNLEILLLR